MSDWTNQLSGVLGPRMASLVGGLIDQSGGVSAIVSQMHQKGLGAMAQSWIGAGANLPISVQQIQAAFGSDKLAALAATFGVHPADLAQRLTSALPQAVDHLTPNGVMPTSP